MLFLRLFTAHFQTFGNPLSSRLLHGGRFAVARYHTIAFTRGYGRVHSIFNPKNRRPFLHFYGEKPRTILGEISPRFPCRILSVFYDFTRFGARTVRVRRIFRHRAVDRRILPLFPAFRLYFFQSVALLFKDFRSLYATVFGLFLPSACNVRRASEIHLPFTSILRPAKIGFFGGFALVVALFRHRLFTASFRELHTA